MKIVNPKVELIKRPEETKENPLQFIERIARVCYKSEDLITQESAEKFVKKLFNMGHYSVFEHIYLNMYITKSIFDVLIKKQPKIFKFLFVEEVDSDFYNIIGNLRAINDLYNQLPNEEKNYNCFKHNGLGHLYEVSNTSDYLSLFIDKIENIPLTFKIICDRGISHEIVRHRVKSFTQESTRYCNYAKDKFDNQISFVLPKDLSPEVEIEFERFYLEAEDTYMKLIRMGVSPQIARSVLPHGIKTEMYCTATIESWKHFIRLRKSVKAHPQVRDIAIKIEEIVNEFYK